MAVAAASAEDISTKPKPFERFVSLSITIFADSTDPNFENISLRESFVAENGKLPT
jgi:hypothetical protein